MTKITKQRKQTAGDRIFAMFTQETTQEFRKALFDFYEHPAQSAPGLVPAR